MNKDSEKPISGEPETPGDSNSNDINSAHEETNEAISPSKDVEVLEKETEELKELLHRVQADFINFKRRADDERTEYQKYSSSRLILKILPILDDFDLAMDHATKQQADAPWLEGVMMIQKKFKGILDSENVSLIETDNREFDPFEHEAMAYEESENHKEGTILSVIRSGYKIHGKVIRPALVTLSKEPVKEPGDYNEPNLDDSSGPSDVKPIK